MGGAQKSLQRYWKENLILIKRKSVCGGLCVVSNVRTYTWRLHKKFAAIGDDCWALCKALGWAEFSSIFPGYSMGIDWPEG